MNTKHTPGPWVAHIEPGYSRYDITAEVNRGPFVVDIIARLPRFRPQFNGPPDEQIANAMLIAAAPTLLKALETIASAHTTDEFARRCARAAIEEVAKKEDHYA